MTKNLTVSGREFSPWESQHFVLCEELVSGGMRQKFGDQVPPYLDLHHLHTHFYNGVVGTKEELESLNGTPVELSRKDPLMPLAMFVSSPRAVQAPLERDEDRDTFSVENAGLLKSKDDLIAYAAEFDIQLKKANNISIKKMIESLEKQAIEKGLIEA